MNSQAWVVCLSILNCLTQWVNISSLRINFNSISILDESERPKTSGLTSYNYIYWKKGRYSKTERESTVSRNIEKLPLFAFATLKLSTQKTWPISRDRFSTRLLLIFVLGNLRFVLLLLWYSKPILTKELTDPVVKKWSTSGGRESNACLLTTEANSKQEFMDVTFGACHCASSWWCLTYTHFSPSMQIWYYRS